MVGNQRQCARKFREYWMFQRGSEKGEDQQFWNSLLGEVLGIIGKGSRRFEIGPSRRGVALLRLTYVFNPTPNDTNLEPKR